MTFDPDARYLLGGPGLGLNATVAATWAVMALLVLGARLLTAGLAATDHPSRRQALMEATVETIRAQIAEIGPGEPARYLPFIGTLFLFIAVSNLLGVLPGFPPPTGSLSTTTALALAVLVAVPVFSIRAKGLRGFLGNYLSPTPLMLPFNVIGELSRTLALAVRLYGNVMSGTVIVAVLLTIAPFVFPVLMQLLGLLTGVIQAYIFAVLAMVYIASASAPRHGARHGAPHPATEDAHGA